MQQRQQFQHRLVDRCGVERAEAGMFWRGEERLRRRLQTPLRSGRRWSQRATSRRPWRSGFAAPQRPAPRLPDTAAWSAIRVLIGASSAMRWKMKAAWGTTGFQSTTCRRCRRRQCGRPVRRRTGLLDPSRRPHELQKHRVGGAGDSRTAAGQVQPPRCAAEPAPRPDSASDSSRWRITWRRGHRRESYGSGSAGA